MNMPRKLEDGLSQENTPMILDYIEKNEIN